MEKSLLLPREQYAEALKKHGRSPFTFEIKNNKQSLFYFGANHSRDPNNHQYPILRDYWQRFLNETEGLERIVLVETNLRKVGSSEEKSIEHGSEGAIVTMWARDSNVVVACPEPSQSALNSLALSQFSKDELAYHWFSVAVSSWHRFPEPRDVEHGFSVFISWFSDAIKQQTIWKDYDFSIPHMREIHKKIFNTEFDENIRTDYTNPNIDKTIINKIARVLSDFRDVHITSEIERYWNEGKSIFVVFGSGHLIIQEPALKKLLK